MTNREALKEYGEEGVECLLNALKERTDQLKTAERWVHIGEALIERLANEPKLIQAANLGLTIQAIRERSRARTQCRKLLNDYYSTQPKPEGHVDVQHLKDQTDLVEIAGRYTTLRQRGQRWWGKCPLHNDSTPSFTVKGQRWHCFGCSIGGDVIDLIKEVEECGFREAVKML